MSLATEEVEAGGVPVLSRARDLILARGVSAGISFVIPLALARLLAPRDYGTYRQLILIAQTLYMIVPLGMAQSLYYFLPRARSGRPYLVQSLLFVSVMGVLSGLGLLAYAPALGEAFHNPELSLLRVPLALYTAGLVISYPLEVSLTARGRIRPAAVTYLVSDGLRIAAMTLPVIAGYGLAGLTWALAVLMAGRTLVAVIYLPLSEAGPLFNGALLREQWRYALPFGLAMAIAVPQQYFHQYAVSASVGAAAFAVYSVGCFQLPVVDLLYTPTSEILMVQIAELDALGRINQAAVVFREAASKLSLLFIPLAAFMFCAAPDFISALFTPRYLESVPILRVALVAVPLASLPVDGALRARDRTRLILISYLVKAAVAVPLVLVGVKLLGIRGAILAWAAGEILGKGMLLAGVPSALQASWRRVLPLQEIGEASAAAVLAGLGVHLMRSFSMFPGPWAALILDGAVFAAIYAGVLHAQGVSLFGLLGTFVAPRPRPHSA